VTAKAITVANQLDGSELEAGSRVIIPVAVGKNPLSDNATYSKRIIRYKVRKGDTVETVAENFGVSAKMVRQWNGLRGDGLRGRKVLALHLPVSPGSEPSASAKSTARARKSAQVASATVPAKLARDHEEDAPAQATIRHTVKTGETLYSIATNYKTTVDALKRTNGNVAVLHPGMILVVEPSR
jgi:membrane-bound lytic murein transglycosylase D